MSEEETQQQKAPVLFVGKIAREATEGEITELFERIGQIAELRMISKRSSAQCAFVTYEKSEDAERAIEELHDFTLHGRNIRVVYSTPQEPKQSSHRGRPREDDYYRRRDDYYDRRYSSPPRRERSPRRDRSLDELEEIEYELGKLNNKIKDVELDLKSRSRRNDNIEIVRSVIDNLKRIRYELEDRLEDFDSRRRAPSRKRYDRDYD